MEASKTTTMVSAGRVLLLIVIFATALCGLLAEPMDDSGRWLFELLPDLARHFGGGVAFVHVGHEFEDGKDLIHGNAEKLTRFIDAVRSEGLVKGLLQFVHMCEFHTACITALEGKRDTGGVELTESHGHILPGGLADLHKARHTFVDEKIDNPVVCILCEIPTAHNSFDLRMAIRSSICV